MVQIIIFEKTKQRMETLLVQPQNKEQLKAVKAFLKALKVDFTTTKNKAYNKEWEEKMKRSEEDYKAGRVKEIKTEDLWR